MKKFYITTAIDYVNAKPHIGHAFEKVLADALARWNKQRGKKVFFLTGVDENAQKNVQAAEKEGVPVKKFVDRNTDFFLELCRKLDIEYDAFIRTSAKEHGKVVQSILKKIISKGDIYKKKYEGLYCVGCEAFITEKDLVDGKCPEHDKKPEFRSEDAYFFKLSKYQKELLKIIPKYVVPEKRANEVLARVKEGLNDLCISRKGVEWGVDFPGDKNFKVYVWIDALINYISGAKKNWPADVHVIGKGINWFHSVIWPAVLFSAGYKIPKTLLVHGYLNLGGRKMSKSLGNVIDPIELLEKYDVDSLRYSLLKCSVYEDSDFSEEILIERHNNELADKLGNLISRVSSLIERVGMQKTENKLVKKLKLKEIERLMQNYEFDKALNEIFAFVDSCNEYIQNKKPWETQDKKVLYELADSIKAIAILLWPFIPSTSEKIAKQFGFKIFYNEIKKPLKVTSVKKGEILFKKIEVDKKVELNEKVNKLEKIEGIMTTNEVSYDEWQKIDLRVAEIKKVEDIEGADKLFKLTLNIGKLGERVICAGIKEHYSKDELKGKKIIVFVNLTPRKMKGIESQGMLLAAVSEDHKKVVLLEPGKGAESGMKVS